MFCVGKTAVVEERNRSFIKLQRLIYKAKMYIFVS